jgi:signal transduction histidine kinase
MSTSTDIVAAPAASRQRPAPAWQDALERGPVWMRASAAALVGYTLFVLTPTGASLDEHGVDLVAAAIRLLIEGGAFFWAAGRADLPARVRLSLRIAAWTSVGAAINYLVLVPARLGGPVLLSPGVDSVLTLAGYVATLAALLVYPRTPARAGESASLAIDFVITVGGLGLLSWTLVTEASVGRITDPMAQTYIRMFGLAQLAMIAGLNVVVVRGVVVPSARAFWWFIAGQTLYLPVVFLSQLSEAGLIADWPIDVVYYAGVLPTLVAAHLFRSDPMTAAADSGPAWLRDLNPLPLAMPLLSGIALLASLVVGPTSAALPLAGTLVAISMLLAARLLLSAHRTAALAAADAAREQRRQAERLQAVGRLAGGVAHEFNNLMARVIGNAELGEASLPNGADARDYFARTRVAAERAADLTSQLLAFSGQQRTRPEAVDVSTLVDDVTHRAQRSIPLGIVLVRQHESGSSVALVDPLQLRAAVEELLDNAAEAMARGGRMVVRTGRQTLERPLVTPWLPVPAGTYVLVAVEDSGIGMTADALRVACDPFYSTKPAHLGAGLGLASVHGFIAAHGGGLAIDSVVGRGTTVRLYLPAV